MENIGYEAVKKLANYVVGTIHDKCFGDEVTRIAEWYNGHRLRKIVLKFPVGKKGAE
jgi:hypothetical protein